MHKICRVRVIKTAELLQTTIERVDTRIDEQDALQDKHDDAFSTLRMEMAEVKDRVAEATATADKADPWST